MNSINQNTAISILRKVKQSNHDALGELMGLFYANLLDYGIKLSGNRELVKDCIQEVFLDVWRRRELADTISHPKFYLLKAVQNKVLRDSNSKTNHAFFDEETVSENASEYAYSVTLPFEETLIQNQIEKDRKKKLEFAISNLPKKQREAVYLRYYQHLDHDHISKLMNISRQSVYNLLYESITKLRKLLPDFFE